MAAYPSTQLAAEPFYAPLSGPMIVRALELQNEITFDLLLEELKEEEEEEKHTPLDEHAQLLLKMQPEERLRARLMKPRQKTFESLAPVVKKGEFDTEFLIQELTRFTPKKTPENTRPLSAESLSHWRKTGLVHYVAKNQPDTDNGAGLLTYRRMVPHRERKWLPNPNRLGRKTFLDEPIWWCWRQDSISYPIVRCPIPLPPDIPPWALLWTDWRGASWKPEWLPVGEIGCCRWAGTKLFEDANQTSTLLWAISEGELAHFWQVPISDFYRQALAATPLTLHSLATSALLLLGTERLEELQAIDPASFSLAG